ncbi:hypothetical protein C5C07_17340 [Haloferax sp. Atlit-4N]|nr:LLM class flavin-dependent oxidoreductase [Haloferax sp. Atlit-4N]RDZ51346.1 hypothetical protein C5C07_17340 [Haloferax sp. Atlit-4N]
MIATLGFISEGRFELGLGAGWRESECDAYGYEYRDGLEWLIHFDEVIRLMKRIWDDEGSVTVQASTATLRS